MQSTWGACPPDVLQRCMSAQSDHNDNAAAACVCTLWRIVFRSSCRAVTLAFGKLRSPPTPLPLRQFQGVSSITLIGSPVEFSKPYDEYQNSSWIEPLKSIPATCTTLNLDVSRGPQDPHNILDSFHQLSSLQQLNLQYDYSVHVPLEALSSFNNLQVLGISCRRHNNKMYLVGSFKALPRSITRLQFSFCDKDEVEPALMFRDLTCLKLLRDLDLSHCITAFGSSGVCAIMNDETAQPAASCASLGLCTQLTRLILTNARLIMDVTLELLAFSALRVLCLRHAISLPNPGTIQVGLKDLVHSLRHLAELDIRQCCVVDMST